VFANGAGGAGQFAGPTGGFLLGYAAAALMAGLVADRRSWGFGRALAGSLAGVAVLYAIGLPWFRAVLDARPDRDVSMLAAFLIMAPYLAGDVVKAVAAAALVKALKPLLRDYLPAGPAKRRGAGAHTAAPAETVPTGAATVPAGATTDQGSIPAGSGSGSGEAR
jgi:biotin transport system substrate-specific component